MSEHRSSILPGDGPSIAVREKIYARAVECGVLGRGRVGSPDPSALDLFNRSVQHIARREMSKLAAVQWASGLAPWVILYGAIFVLASNDDGGAWQAYFLAVALMAFALAVAWAIWFRVKFSRFRRRNRPVPEVAVYHQCIRFAEALVATGPLEIDDTHRVE